MTKSFILASASPRRRELLKCLGLTFDVLPSDIDEISLENENPQDQVLRLAREKSVSVAQVNPGRWVLGADTIVVADRHILGKPSTPEEARTMLTLLSGRAHSVITGYSIVNARAGVIENRAVESLVIFKDIDEDEKDWYVSSREPYDKAGGYAVQGMASYFVKEIQGSYTNVVGLPLCEVVTSLKEVGAVKF
jgi:septum formation protein